jgi:hypothetical protein
MAALRKETRVPGFAPEMKEQATELLEALAAQWQERAGDMKRRLRLGLKGRPSTGATTYASARKRLSAAGISDARARKFLRALSPKVR